jgi:hypothetical protein
MSEDTMVALVQRAIQDQGIQDEVVAAGQFNPRGRTGGLFAGGLIGGEVTKGLGGVAEGVGLAVGSLAGMHAAEAASGLPEWMLVGVSETTIYGFASRSRHVEPTDLVFRVPREGLKVSVHKRVNVRVLELIDEESGSTIELEGNRLPLTHSKDVIQVLVG